MQRSLSAALPESYSEAIEALPPQYPRIFLLAVPPGQRDFHIGKSERFRPSPRKASPRFRNRMRVGNRTIDARPPSPLGGAIPLGLRKAATPHGNCSEPTAPKFARR